jgi:hypothetical protein
MRRMSARISADIAGRPGLPRRTFQVQNFRTAFRCQAIITVSGLRIFNAERHSGHTPESPTQKRRSALSRISVSLRSVTELRSSGEAHVFQLESSAAFQRRRSHHQHQRHPLQRQIKQFMECVQRSSSQPVRHLREPHGNCIGTMLDFPCWQDILSSTQDLIFSQPGI